MEEFAGLLPKCKDIKDSVLCLDLTESLLCALIFSFLLRLLLPVYRLLASSPLSLMKSFFPNGTPNIVPVLESEKSPHESDKEIGIINQHPYATDKDGEEGILSDAQFGVQKIEATTSVWSTSHLVTAYILYAYSYTHFIGSSKP